MAKSMKSSGVPSGSKIRWRGRSKKGNTVMLLSRKGFSKIKVVNYRSSAGRRRMVITHRVLRK